MNKCWSIYDNFRGQGLHSSFTLWETKKNAIGNGNRTNRFSHRKWWISKVMSGFSEGIWAWHGHRKGRTSAFAFLAWQPVTEVWWPRKLPVFAPKRALVGGIPNPLKNMTVSWDDSSQYMGKYITCSKPPTCHHPILHVKDGVQSSAQRFSWEERSLNYPPDPTADVVLWGNSQKRKIFEAGFLNMLHSTCSKSAQHPHHQTYFVMLLSVLPPPPHGGFLKRDYISPNQTLCSKISINLDKPSSYLGYHHNAHNPS